MSALRKIGTYLGFVEEDLDEYYDETPETPARREPEPVREAHVAEPASAAPAPVEEYREPAEVTPIRASVRPVESAPESSMQRIKTIHPRSYNDAKDIGTAFRDGIPVIVNLTAMDDTNSKRLVDFSVGLIFGLHGSIEKVTNKVFLLTPENVEVSTEREDESDEQATFFNQN